MSYWFQNQDSVRAAAFRLFGNLSKFSNGPSAAPFQEQINNNLTALLLHLNDRHEDVVSVRHFYFFRNMYPMSG